MAIKELDTNGLNMQDEVIRKGQMCRVKLFDGKGTIEIAPAAVTTPFHKPGTMHVIIGGHLRAAKYPPLGIFIETDEDE